MVLENLGATSGSRRVSTVDLTGVFLAHRPDFLAYAKRLLGNAQGAEEIVQDALVKTLLAAPNLSTNEHAKAYLFRAIQSLAIDLQRRENRRPRLLTLDEVSMDLEFAAVGRKDLESSLVAAEDAAIIREALSLLSPAERAAIVMWEIEGRTTEDIAAELGVNPNRVRHTVSRARASLRKLLTNRIVDQDRGLTALDLLSYSFKKSKAVVEKSSRAALSLVLILGAFFGIQNLIGSSKSFQTGLVDELTLGEKDLPRSSSGSSNNQLLTESDRDSGRSAVLPPPSNSKEMGSTSGMNLSSPLEFAGLDQEGRPVGFTIVDSQNRVGELFVGPGKTGITETGLMISNIVSTRSGATGFILDQAVIVDGFGTNYIADALVVVGGQWISVDLTWVSSEVVRLGSGDYLLTAVGMIDSSKSVPTVAPVGNALSGQSLPSGVAIKILLDPSKTQILTQAVALSGSSQEGKA